jgi:CheY-like chemotaxis protein
MANEKILVIEDNQMNMKLFRDLLRLEGYNVLEAVDAETGIPMARENSPDLILMDIQLPGMDGLQAPVVALTSFAMKGDESMAKEAGCVGYITKPINTRSFVEMISGFIKRD